MGRDINLYPIPKYSWDGNDHIRLMTEIICDRDSTLFHQFNLYGSKIDEDDPDPVVSLRPVPNSKVFYLDGEYHENDRIGGQDSEPNFVFLWASDFKKIDPHIVEHHICRAAVFFMQALPGDWPVLVWRA